MLVCHCHGKNEGAVRQCIADGARNECEVGNRIGAGTKCGGCLPLLRALIEEAQVNGPTEFSIPHTAA